MKTSDLDRFYSKTDKSWWDGCRYWSAYKNAGGYGVFGVGQRSVLAHRFAWEVERGPIPDGMTIDHLCRHRDCVNPRHMEVVTPRENKRRQRPPHHIPGLCRSGRHLMTADNMNPSGREKRICKACHAEKGAANYRRKKGL